MTIVFVKMILLFETHKTQNKKTMTIWENTNKKATHGSKS